MNVFSSLSPNQSAQARVLPLEDRTHEHSFPMLEAPEWCARAVVLLNEPNKSENVSQIVLSQPKPAFSEKTKIKEKTFTKGSLPKEKAPEKDKAQKPQEKRKETVASFVFSQPQTAFPKKTDKKEETTFATKEGAVEARSTARLVEFAAKICLVIIKTLFGSLFFASEKPKVNSANKAAKSFEKVNAKKTFSEKPKPATQPQPEPQPLPKKAPSNTPNKPAKEKASQTQTSSEKPKSKEDMKKREPKVESKPEAFKPKPTSFKSTNSTEKTGRTASQSFTSMPNATMPNAKMPNFHARNYRAPLFTPKAQAIHPKKQGPSSIGEILTVPQDIREKDAYKKSQAFRRLVIIYNRLDGKLKEGATKAHAEKQLMEIFKVQSLDSVKKEYKKLCLLIHPDKALQFGLKDESQKYLSKLFAFINSYYGLI